VDPASPDFFRTLAENDSFSSDVTTSPFFQGAKDLPDFMNQALNAHKMTGVDKMPAPKDDWSEEQWNEHHNRMGRPETPDQYKAPEGVEESFDQDALKGFRELMHKRGLSADVGSELIGRYAEYAGEVRTAEAARVAEVVSSGLSSLREKWGGTYETNLDMANQAFERMAPESLKALVNENPLLANNPGLLEFFHTLGSQIGNDPAAYGLEASQGMFTSGSPAHAQQQLDALIEKHGKIIFTDPSTLSLPDRDAREKILKERTRLLALTVK
jgi:hypothetical protein